MPRCPSRSLPAGWGARPDAVPNVRFVVAETYFRAHPGGVADVYPGAGTFLAVFGHELPIEVAVQAGVHEVGARRHEKAAVPEELVQLDRDVLVRAHADIEPHLGVGSGVS